MDHHCNTDRAESGPHKGNFRGSHYSFASLSWFCRNSFYRRKIMCGHILKKSNFPISHKYDAHKNLLYLRTIWSCFD